MPLNKDQIENLGLEEKLKNHKQKLRAQLEILKKELDFGDDVDHLEEESDESEEYYNYAGIEIILNRKIEEIDKALARIASQTYGDCLICKQPIPIERLKIEPEAELCVKCEKEKEKND